MSDQEPRALAPRLPSDTLPLALLGGVIVCFALYFAQALVETGAAAGTPPELAQNEVYDLEVCNHTTANRVYLAVAYYDRIKRDFVARGWFPQDQGACTVALKNLTPPVFVYGESKDGKGRWGNADAGQEFCIAQDGAFVLDQKRCRTLADGERRWQRFKRLELSGTGGVHTWEMTE